MAQTQRQSIVFFHERGGTNSHVLLCSRAHFSNHSLLPPRMIKCFYHIVRNSNRIDGRNIGKIGRSQPMVVVGDYTSTRDKDIS